MGVSKRLTEQQRKFAQLLVYNKSKKSNTQCAIEAGYAEGSSSVKACNLLNPNKYPLVVKYIGELQAEKDLILKDKALDVSLQIINYLDKEIRERKKIPLSKLYEYRDIVVGITNEPILTVYIAIENRTDTTPYFKIGKTVRTVAKRSQTNVTDNPFPLKYFAAFKYETEGHNLEQELLKRLAPWNAYQENKGGTEWFKSTGISTDLAKKYFLKACKSFCEQHNLMGKEVIREMLQE